jgi:hypothetical protein
MTYLKLVLAFGLCFALAACEKKQQEPAPVAETPQLQNKLSLLGINLSTATKSSLTRAFTSQNMGFIERINPWEEVWTAGSLMQGATRIKVGFTEEGNLSYLQYDFNETTNPEQTNTLYEFVVKQFGASSNQEGEVKNTSEFVANWDMGDGMRVMLRRKYPKNTNHLTYFNDPAFETLKLEYKIATRKSIEQRKNTLSLMY